MSRLLERMEKYKESLNDDDGYVLEGEADVLVFKALDEIKRLRQTLENIAEVDNDYYQDDVDEMRSIATKALEETK